MDVVPPLLIGAAIAAVVTTSQSQQSVDPRNEFSGERDIIHDSTLDEEMRRSSRARGTRARKKPCKQKGERFYYIPRPEGKTPTSHTHRTATNMDATGRRHVPVFFPELQTDKSHLPHNMRPEDSILRGVARGDIVSLNHFVSEHEFDMQPQRRVIEEPLFVRDAKRPGKFT